MSGHGPGFMSEAGLVIYAPCMSNSVMANRGRFKGRNICPHPALFSVILNGPRHNHNHSGDQSGKATAALPPLTFHDFL
jgi:hypothetical protein